MLEGVIEWEWREAVRERRIKGKSKGLRPSCGRVFKRGKSTENAQQCGRGGCIILVVGECSKSLRWFSKSYGSLQCCLGISWLTTYSYILIHLFFLRSIHSLLTSKLYPTDKYWDGSLFTVVRYFIPIQYLISNNSFLLIYYSDPNLFIIFNTDKLIKFCYSFYFI